MYLKFDKSTEGELTLDYIFVTVGLKATYSKDFQWVVYGVPVYVSLAASGTARGLIGAVGGSDALIAENVKDKAFYALLGKYGQDAIPNDNYDANLSWEIPFFRALYNQANLTKDDSQAENALIEEFDAGKMDATISALDTMLNRYDFYYDNEALFEPLLENFSYDLRSRINTYKQLVTVTGRFDTVAQADSGNGETRPPYQSSVTIDYDKTQVTQAWVYRLNLLLLMESLPDYLGDSKPVYDVSSEMLFGLADNDPDHLGKVSTTGIISLKPTFAVGAGIGQRGPSPWVSPATSTLWSTGSPGAKPEALWPST